MPVYLLIILTLAAMAQTPATPPPTPKDAAWDVLKKALGEANPDKRIHAITAIASIGLEKDAVRLVEVSLHDNEILVRQTAAALLGEMQSRPSIPRLREALDESPEVAFTAAKALWQMGDRGGRDVFEDVLAGEIKNSPGLMQGTARRVRATLRNPKALTLMGIKEASAALVPFSGLGFDAAQEVMKDSGAPGRTLAVTMLTESCNDTARDLMELVLISDKNWGVRAATARALGRCGNAATVPKLEPLLEDSHDTIRDMAAASIVRLTLPKPATRARPKTAPKRR
jgi:HEAT repeat protein